MVTGAPSPSVARTTIPKSRPASRPVDRIVLLPAPGDAAGLKNVKSIANGMNQTGHAAPYVSRARPIWLELNTTAPSARAIARRPMRSRKAQPGENGTSQITIGGRKRNSRRSSSSTTALSRCAQINAARRPVSRTRTAPPRMSRAPGRSGWSRGTATGVEHLHDAAKPGHDDAPERSVACTSSAIASADVSPGLSIPNRFTNPGIPCTAGPCTTKSCACCAGTIFGRIPA